MFEFLWVFLTHLLQVKHLHFCCLFFKTCCYIFLASINIHSFSFLIYTILHSEHVSEMFSNKANKYTWFLVCKNTLDYIINPFHWSLLSSGPQTECNNILSVSGLNASSFWNKNCQEQTMFWSCRNMVSSHDLQPWAAGANDADPWVELELSDRSTITGMFKLECEWEKKNYLMKLEF